MVNGHLSRARIVQIPDTITEILKRDRCEKVEVFIKIIFENINLHGGIIQYKGKPYPQKVDLRKKALMSHGDKKVLWTLRNSPHYAVPCRAVPCHLSHFFVFWEKK